MRIGIFGGTFDPVHLGHLITADQCREQGRLDQVWFIPAARPPHKVEQEVTGFARRAEMLALALAGHSAFRVDDLEKDRPGPSYTVETLESLARLHPDAELSFIVGADSLADFGHWREPGRILELARLLIVPRPGWSAPSNEEMEKVLGEGISRMVQIEIPLIDLSSRDIRKRAAEGRSIRYMVPRAVECYIETHQLYRNHR